MIHTVKEFSVFNEVDFFPVILLPLLWSPMNTGNLISGSSAFSKSSLNIWKLSVHVLLKPSWRILSIALLTCEMSAIVW